MKSLTLKKLTLTTTILTATTCLGQDLSVCDTTKFKLPYDVVTTLAPLSVSTNASLLPILSVGTHSDAAAGYSRPSGDLHDYYQAASADQYAVDARSLYQLSPRVALSGRASYLSSRYHSVAGSAFIDGRDAPFDLIEYTPGREGLKTFEKYVIEGHVGYLATDRLSIGAGLDFSSSNIAKHRDVRHKNNRLDMTVSAGLSYRLSSALTLGANYIYRRAVEGVEFATYGVSDNQIYYTMVNYGAFFGINEAFGQNGYTESNKDKPLVDNRHGAAVQALWTPSASLTVSAQARYLSRSGFYGQRSPYTVVYSNHSGDIAGLDLSMTLARSNARHAVSLSASNDMVTNRENIYRSGDNGSGVTDVTYYGSNEVGKRQTMDMGASYVFYSDLSRGFSPWTASASWQYSRRDEKGTVYPYQRRLVVSTHEAAISGKRAWARGKNLYGVSLEATMACGSIDRLSTDIIGTASSSTPAVVHEGYEQQHTDYVTATRPGACIAASWTRSLGSLDISLSASARYVRATSGDASRFTPAIGLSCAF